MALGKTYFSSDPQEAIKYNTQAKELADQIKFQKGAAYALKNIGIAYYVQGKYVEALSQWQQSLAIFDSIKDKMGVANLLSNLGVVHFNQGDDAKALEYYLQSLKVSEEIGDTLRIATALINIGAVYFNKPATKKKALEYYLKALPLSEAHGDKDAIGTCTVNLGEIYLDEGDDESALFYFKRSLKAYEGSENILYSLNDMGKVYEHKKDYNQAIKYHLEAYNTAKKLDAKLDIVQSLLGLGKSYEGKGDNRQALSSYIDAQELAKEVGANYELKNAYQGLSDVYSNLSDYKNAFKYQNLLLGIKDTLYNIETDKKLSGLQFNFEIEKKQGQIDLLTKDKALQQLDIQKQKVAKNAFLGGLILIFFIAFILYRNFRNQKKSNLVIEQKNDELNTTLTELKATQQQLIQSEKLASLGALTAGIAHEIKNPLNFVNNFSELSNELIVEMETATEEEDRIELLGFLKQNLSKINHHGKRADNIVKSMLEHSRTSTGEKQLTDMNRLCEEYLNLAYNGMLANDHEFRCKIETHLDPELPKVNLVAQDISRVVLNLVNNALQAVNERQKHALNGYEPTVTVSSRRDGNGVAIEVKDNGTGIPDNIKEKIFEPFFTTKPTGQGTGLGLSISFDIVRAHRGDIKVESVPQQFTTFTMHLPAEEKGS